MYNILLKSMSYKLNWTCSKHWPLILVYIVSYLYIVVGFIEHGGPPDPLCGNAPYLAVRQEAKVQKPCLCFFLAAVGTENDICVFL